MITDAMRAAMQTGMRDWEQAATVAMGPAQSVPAGQHEAAYKLLTSDPVEFYKSVEKRVGAARAVREAARYAEKLAKEYGDG